MTPSSHTHTETVAIIGLGYVGLPLAVALAKKHPVIGFDVDTVKLTELSQGHDRMREVSAEHLRAVSIRYTATGADLRAATVFIVAVPTPVDDHNVPDLEPVRSATRTVAPHLTKGSIVVFESTVYPGVTEDICIPLLEQGSGLRANVDFAVGYSPERINPGDAEHSLSTVVKIVSASTPAAAERLKQLYGSIVSAGIHVAPSIKVAEAAKVVENVQRDINIALINELTILFDRLDINIHDVLDAAGTKWNFHKYSPGLVGGHCIGVDPYYLTYKAIEVNYHPNIILSGRRINDRMHSFYAQKLIRALNKNGVAPSKARIAVLGLTFKENCADTRNSRVKHLIKELHSWGATVYGVDPWLSTQEIEAFAAKPLALDSLGSVKPDAVLIAAPHDAFASLALEWVPLVLDIKGRRTRLNTSRAL